MEQKARVKITLNYGEFEVEGSEDFVNSYTEEIKHFLTLLEKGSSGHVQEAPLQRTATPTQGTLFDNIPSAPPLARQDNNQGSFNGMESFGEFYHRRPKNVSKTDIVLMASYYIQSKSDEGIFTTREVTKLLKDHGLDLSNPAHFIKLNQEYKKVFKMRQGQYKVSEEGVDHLKSILR